MVSVSRIAALGFLLVTACERGATTPSATAPSTSGSTSGDGPVTSLADAAAPSRDGGSRALPESEDECAKAAGAAKAPPPRVTALPLAFGNPKRVVGTPSGLHEIAGDAFDAYPAISADGKEIVFLWEGGADFADIRSIGLDWYGTANGKRTKRLSLFDDSALFQKSEREADAIRARLRDAQVNDLASAKQMLAKSQWQRLVAGRHPYEACPNDPWEATDRKRIERHDEPKALRFDAVGVDIELDAKNEHVLWVRTSPTQKPLSVNVTLPPGATTCGMTGKPPCGKPCGGLVGIEGWMTADRAFLFLAGEVMIPGDSCSATLYGDRFTVVRMPPLK